MDEESSKKNTDCVYFLASPLTCKKGVQCEFRHSEVARLNPRDCWYWINGNCLNDDCPFRHPPLDGAEDEPEVIPETTTGRVPCYYYFQGYCARGDSCSFMHGYPRLAQDQAAGAQKGGTTAAPITEPIESEAPKDVPSVSLNEGQFVVTEEEKHIEPLEDCFSPKEVPYEYAQHSLQEGDVENSEEIVVDSGFDSHRRLRHDDSLHSMVEGGEWVKESSPGFDVLVDAGADQALYCQDANYVCDHDAVLDPGNGDQLIVDGHVRGFHRLGDIRPDYTYSCSYDPCGNLHNRIRDDYRDYQVYDPPYQPSNPYDYLISSPQGVVDHQVIDATQRWREFEAALLARNFAVKRRRLQDRLVFPRRNLANRLKYLNRHNDELVFHEQLPGHVVRPSGERAGLWRFANNIHSRLGSRVSMKSRLQGRLRFANQRKARYLGIARHSRSKISKHKPRMTETRIKESEFAGPKTLAELKAAKLSIRRAAVKKHHQAEPYKLASNTEAGKKRVITLNTSTDKLTSEDKRDFEGPKPLCAILQEKCQNAGKGVAEQGISSCIIGIPTS